MRQRGQMENGPKWRQMGKRDDKRFCFASLPGAAGKEFMGEVNGSDIGQITIEMPDLDP